MQTAQSGLFKILGDQLRSNPERFYQTAGKSLWEKINTLKYAIPQVGSTSNNIYLGKSANTYLLNYLERVDYSFHLGH